MIQGIKQKCVKICMPLALSTCFLFQSCQNEVLNELLLTILVTAANGWIVENENMDEIPQDIDVVDVDENKLPSKVDLEKKFPPIGNQGNYGTCVVWASGYNLKTALDGIDKNWTPSQLANPSNQSSPADLWYAIPSAASDCNGTNFEPALTALISSGAASLSDVPYSRLDVSCSGKAKGNSSAKLANFRKIADGQNQGMTVANFKYYLSQGRPIVFGARLGDRFMAWNSSSVINYDTYVKEGMQHAYHAMALSGYDDSKQAFRVRNSWGKDWGDNGSIWVDYDFFLSEFMFAAFVAQNTNSVSFTTSGGIAEKDLTSGYDLLAYSAEDYEDISGTSDLDRVFSYTIYNSGTNAISASQKWRVLYMYYNATDANDYQVIYEDYYTNEYGDVEGDYEPLASSDALCGGYWNNINAPAGQSVGDDFEIQYTMPNITGKYYLVVYADAYDAIAEGNEDNNFYFITAENGKPLEFVNGIIQNTMVSSVLKADKIPTTFENTKTQTTVRNGNLNAYTPNELATILHRDKESGKLDAKLAQLKSSTIKAKKVRK